MTIIILLFSLIINIFAILAIFVLYSRQNRLMHIEKSQEQAMKDMEVIFSSYIAEMKEENEHFILKMKEMQTEEKNRLPEADSKHFQEEEKGRLPEIPQSSYKRILAEKLYQNTIDVSNENINEQVKDVEDKVTHDHKPLSFEDQVLFLHNKGLTADEIAQNLNKGKTEIELFLKFRQKH